MISVVIPTHNRIDALRKTLIALKEQTLPSNNYEILIINDGSNENVSDTVLSLSLPYRHYVLNQEKRGPAAARNLGASQASGTVIVFLDNDIIVKPDFLLIHLECHQKHPHCLVIGPRSPITVPGVNNILEKFDYSPYGDDLRLSKQPLTYQEAFTCNLSIQIEDWQQLRGFNEEFPSSSYEDIEFAYRAMQSGMCIFLEPSALGFHDHPVTLEQRCQRAVSYTSTVPLLYRIHPELRGQIDHLRDKEPINWRSDSSLLFMKKMAHSVFALSPVIKTNLWILNILMKTQASERWLEFFYWKIIGSHQWIGLRQGIKQYGWMNEHVT
jgi:glycosyltransferase involved in cell wall biosynthesis